MWMFEKARSFIVGSGAEPRPSPGSVAVPDGEEVPCSDEEGDWTSPEAETSGDEGWDARLGPSPRESSHEEERSSQLTGRGSRNSCSPPPDDAEDKPGHSSSTPAGPAPGPARGPAAPLLYITATGPALRGSFYRPLSLARRNNGTKAASGQGPPPPPPAPQASADDIPPPPPDAVIRELQVKVPPPLDSGGSIEITNRTHDALEPARSHGDQLKPPPSRGDESNDSSVVVKVSPNGVLEKLKVIVSDTSVLEKPDVKVSHMGVYEKPDVTVSHTSVWEKPEPEVKVSYNVFLEEPEVKVPHAGILEKPEVNVPLDSGARDGVTEREINVSRLPGNLDEAEPEVRLVSGPDDSGDAKPDVCVPPDSDRVRSSEGSTKAPHASGRFGAKKPEAAGAVDSSEDDESPRPIIPEPEPERAGEDADGATASVSRTVERSKVRALRAMLLAQASPFSETAGTPRDAPPFVERERQEQIPSESDPLLAGAGTRGRGRLGPGPHAHGARTSSERAAVKTTCSSTNTPSYDNHSDNYKAIHFQIEPPPPVRDIKPQLVQDLQAFFNERSRSQLQDPATSEPRPQTQTQPTSLASPCKEKPSPGIGWSVEMEERNGSASASGRTAAGGGAGDPDNLILPLSVSSARSGRSLQVQGQGNPGRCAGETERDDGVEDKCLECCIYYSVRCCECTIL